MTNQDVAKKLREVYVMMQLAGENRFRAIAFDRAAQTIEGLNDEIQTHIHGDTLTEIKGIGNSIAEDIRALAETGTMPVLEDLKERVPKRINGMAEHLGFRPKKYRKNP
jgi:DNA polymerase IV (family X)